MIRYTFPSLPLYLPTSALSMEVETSADGVVVLAVPNAAAAPSFSKKIICEGNKIRSIK